MSASTKSLLTRTLTSKLEIERKFVPTPLLLKCALENPRNETILLPSSKPNNNLPRVVLSRIPRKRVTDKYFDRNGQLESKGIWVRWRREQLTAHDGKDAATANGTDGYWEAKIKQGGNFVNSRFSEVRGREAVEGLMAEAGVGNSVYDLRFELGFMADRFSWAVKEFGSGQEGDGGEGDDAAALTLVLDSMLASLEGLDGSHPKYMQHKVGELEFEKTIKTDIATTAITDNSESEDMTAITDADSPFTATKNKHTTTCTSESNVMNAHLEAFMSAHPELFAGEGTPKGKLTAYIDQKKELAARDWKANASGRLANLSEVKYKRLFGGK